LLDLLVPTGNVDSYTDEEKALPLAAIDMAISMADKPNVSFHELAQLVPREMMDAVLQQLAPGLADVIQAELDVFELRNLARVWEMDLQLVDNYVTQYYPGPVTLFLASEEEKRSEEDINPWREVAGGGLEIHWTPGTHVNFVSPPHVSVLAERLRECIDRASDDGV
jgi:thioesterase domain-containing protein